MVEPYISHKIEDRVSFIEFFHPKSNALPSSLLNKLASEIEKAGLNEEVRVIHLRSAGEKTFCAGASFDELLSINDEDEGTAFFSGFANVIAAMKNAPKFIVTAVQGKAIGGGVGLLAASDFVIATNNAATKLSELAIGIGPFVIGPAVERKIGLAQFSHLTLSPKEWFNADWNYQAGLFNQVVNNIEELKIATSSKIEEFKNYAPQASKEIKAMLWSGADDIEAEMRLRAQQSGKLVLSDFTKQTLKAFKKK